MLFNKHLLLLVLFVIQKGNTQNWTCDDGSKIQAGWKCDGETDCGDGSDESTDNCPSRECQFDEFKCLSGICIPYVLVCNGEVNCGVGGIYDNSDESQDCGNLPEQKETTCTLTTDYQCNNSVCISHSWVCDGVDDCGDNSDEQNCDQACQQGHIRCNHTSTCVKKEWICDGHNDCVDGEDESNCSANLKLLAPSTLSTCSVDEFLCGDKCLSIEKACDGKPDCLNGDDEGVHCQSDICRQRSDPLAWNSKGPLCDQLCRPTPQGPKCFCQPGYTLKADGITCKTEGPDVPKLYFSMGNEIDSFSLQSNIVSETLEFKEYRSPQAKIECLNYDKELDTLIWYERQSSTIQIMNRLLFNKVLVQADDVTGLALDWITKNLYLAYKSPKGSRKLGIININRSKGFTSNKIIDLDFNVTNPTSIVVYPQKRRMIVIDQGNSQISSRLILADMDGKNVEALASDRRRMVTSVTVDKVTDVIYWSEVDDKEACIKMMKIGGLEQKTLLTSKDGGINFSNPTSLSVFENVLYFGDSDSGEIWAVDSLNGKPINLTKGHPTPLLKADLASRLLSLHVYHPVMQRQAEDNPCQFTNCSHACVLHPRGTSCLCPQSMSQINETTCLALGQSSVDAYDENFEGNEVSPSPVTKKPTGTFSTTVQISNLPTTQSLPSSNLDMTSTFCSRPQLSSSGAKLYVARRIKMFAVGTQIVYSCKEGWYMQDNPFGGNLTLTCLTDGHWNETIKPCFKNSCSNFQCGNEGRCIITTNGGAACQCSDGTRSFSTCNLTTTVATSTFASSTGNLQLSGTDQTGKIIAIVLVLLLLPSFCAYLLWKFIKRTKKYFLLQKRCTTAAPIFRCSATVEDTGGSREMTSKFVSDGSEENLSFTKSKYRSLSCASDENDSGVDRSNSSLSSGGSPASYNYKRLIESDETLIAVENLNDESYGKKQTV